MRLTVAILTIIAGIALFSYQPVYKKSKAAAVEQWYIHRLQELKSSVFVLLDALENNGPRTTIQPHFKVMRMNYKKLAVITDYFNVYETIQLNGPALNRTEEDHPTNIIAPHGFQPLEELIWNDDPSDANRKNMLSETRFILGIIEKLEQEPDRVNKFTNERVWDALQSTVITIITKGITGFDSPVAQYSLPESMASLEAMIQIIGIYKLGNENSAVVLMNKIENRINKAIAFIIANNNFNAFDRLRFIRETMNPISDRLSEAVAALGFRLPVERRPLNDKAKNIFESNAFDVNFFSPNSRYQVTEERILLGKKLFYDTRLSGTHTRSCASCHKPELAFTDGLTTALALDNKTSLQRNTPTLLNAVYQTKQFFDSRQTMLEFQVSSVVHNEAEMGGSIKKTAAILKTNKEYMEAFAVAYQHDKEPVSIYTIANAIASYIRSLQSLNSRFDQYMRNESVSFSASEKNGFNLFMGKAKCGTCHFIPLFNGLVPPQFNETESEVLGVPANTKKQTIIDADSGKYYFTHSPVHLYAFKTPTVRNISLTAPYMHNGVYKTLSEVMDFYNKGGGKGLGINLPNQSLPFDKLDLSKKERKDIIAFMGTLTDTSSYKN